MANTSPYQGLPRTSFWKTAASGRTPSTMRDVAQNDFRVRPTDRVMTAGSCFAQHIAQHLKLLGFNVLDYEPGPRRTSLEWNQAHGFDIYSGRYGNIYYVRQLKQLLEEAEGLREPSNWIWTKNEHFFDALRPSVEPEGWDTAAEVAQERKLHLDAVRRLVRDANVFVFTLGLTEAWEHVVSGTVYPTAPGTVAGTWDPDTIRFRNFTHSEVKQDLEDVIDIVNGINPDMQFIFTVSPVALAATAAQKNVIVANSYSKAVLRSVVGEVTDTRANAHYFPSYDIITGLNSADRMYLPDQRSVSPETVRTIMSIFAREMVDNGVPKDVATPGSTSGSLTARESELQSERQMCEDALLEDFAQ
ncbi:GSCFA domain-containing protein [Kocuria sp.]|uniref:GSCFA domain-containing protein n=1 Tax=Kocuria sp. TaxID=1871328 RepID=UPI00289B3EEE|nr:GSCFA domain-containing protein [Kocuria sp.]